MTLVAPYWANQARTYSTWAADTKCHTTDLRSKPEACNARREGLVEGQELGGLRRAPGHQQRPRRLSHWLQQHARRRTALRAASRCQVLQVLSDALP